MSPMPSPVGDLFSAGAAMRDRGRYLRAGTFTWLGSGSIGFTGLVLGYAPYSANDDVVDANEAFAGGSIGIDGGTAFRVHGTGPIALDRHAASSVQVNGGIAWGVALPTGMAWPANGELKRAIDRKHKDGSMQNVNYDFDLGNTAAGFNMGFLGTGTNIVNQAGPGALLAVNIHQKMNSWSSGQTMCSGLDVYIDGTYRFSLINGHRQEYSQSSSANGWRGVGGSVGFIPFASNLTVQLRRGSDNGQRIEASVNFLLGSIT